MFYNSLKYLFTIIAPLSILLGCMHEIPNYDSSEEILPCETTSLVHFDNDIRPILTSSCAIPGCHDSQTPTALIDLSSYDAIMSTEVRGEPIVIPGDPNNSTLARSLRSLDIIVPMPPPFNYQITIAQKNLIRRWIAEGATNPETCVDITCDTSVFNWTNVIRPIITTYCTGCHFGDYALGELELTNHLEVQEIALNGDLLDAIRGNGEIRLMPTDKPLPECNIIQIEKWIENGAPKD